MQKSRARTREEEAGDGLEGRRSRGSNGRSRITARPCGTGQCRRGITASTCLSQQTILLLSSGLARGSSSTAQ
eukprot:168169-Hanusia_phi.AAC.2